MALEIRKEDIRPEFKIIEDVKDEPTLKSAQEFVGGYVEGISFPNGDYLIINEEGKLIGLPINEDYEPELTDDRVKNWVADIKPQFGL